ncbi:TonB-dependent receptor plug domain-containing protein [Myroides odoratimimus]|uniref:TonB-dependent receptor plug domain-containing protein n=1 Tax=Myroides odoratimimus TaxID=76832 RepID=UPI003100EDFF
MYCIKHYTIILLFVIFNLPINKANAQNTEIKLTIQDSLQSPIANVFIEVQQKQGATLYFTTDQRGIATLSGINNNYLITTSHLSYHTIVQRELSYKNLNPIITLKAIHTQLKDIVISAKESGGLSTKSVINREAMEHLQPSSFADLMELLPGGKTKTPNLTSSNRILIREFGQSGGQYNTSSLGVQFLVDGAIINSNADLQTSSYEDHTIKGTYVASKRNTSSIGLDMRTIPTNDIESVEIIRGIPSASYGDLTSGLVLINRKIGKKALEARLKADGFSKLFYLSKGFSLSPTWHINTNIDFLNSKSDPRNLTEQYNRYGISIRSRKIFDFADRELNWYTTLDYNANIDKNKIDPDVGYEKIDTYKNNRHTILFNNRLLFKFHEHKLFKTIELKTNIRQGIEDLKQRRLVQFSGPTSISIATQTGVNDGYYPTTTFISDFKTHGRPLDINASLKADLEFMTFNVKHQIETGIDYRYSKNNGKGQIYDILLPPSPSMTTRPRPFNDIPALQNLASFFGDKMQYNLENQSFSLYAGLRASTLVGMDKKYSIANKLYLEPRINFQWNLPKVWIASKPLQTNITLGYGELYKQPTLGMLYPNKAYLDYTQLNFAHINPNIRRVNYMTYVIDLTNLDLLAAKNIKKELRLDLEYQGHKIFMTYFDEKMQSGFRSVNNFQTYAYKRYNTSDIDIHQMTQQPNLEELPYIDKLSLNSRSITNNGSETCKRGIEFGYYSPRIKSIKTKFSFTGAYFNTTYKNSVPVQEKPSVSLNGEDYKYVGIYSNSTGYKKSGLNYNLLIDTYLQDIGMSISASIQGTWFLNENNTYKAKDPITYFGTDGIVHPFLEQDKQDLYKQWLVRNVSSTDNMGTRYPFDVQVNLKITKKIVKKLGVSLFVNKLFDYYKPYYFNGYKVDRSTMTDPYFGMELTYNF